MQGCEITSERDEPIDELFGVEWLQVHVEECTCALSLS